MNTGLTHNENVAPAMQKRPNWSSMKSWVGPRNRVLDGGPLRLLANLVGRIVRRLWVGL